MSEPTDDQIDALLEEVSAVDVPEPSPLFWDQFAARVSAALDAAPTPRGWWQKPAAWAWTAAAAVIVVVSILGFSLTRPELEPRTPAIVATPAAQPDTTAIVIDAADADPAMERDEAWAVVRSLADELEYEEAREAGVVPRPGAIDRAATELTAEERAELVRIIQSELKRAGA